MKDILELVIVLTVICLASAFSLAKVYDITKEPIAIQQRLAKMKAIHGVLPPHDNEPDQNIIHLPWETAKGEKEEILIYKGIQDGKLTGVAFGMSAMGFGGPVTLMMGLNLDGTIEGVEITSMVETPGLGAKILEPSFKDQFRGKSLQNSRFQLKKDGGDLDQVTGATISPRAVVKAIRDGLELYTNKKEKILQ